MNPKTIARIKELLALAMMLGRLKLTPEELAVINGLLDKAAKK